MGQSLSRKVLQRHVTEASKMEKILQQVFGDISLRVTVLTGKILHDPLEVVGDFVGSVKYLLIYDPSVVTADIGDVVVKENNEEDVWRISSQDLKKKVLKCKDFLLLRRLCYEYERVMEIRSLGAKKSESADIPSLKAGEKRVESFDPDECSICMDASIDIVLPCLHGYCTSCWDDWSSHSSTCPHCRGEVKEGSAEQDGDGSEELWQYETWDDGILESRQVSIKNKLSDFMTTLPVDLTSEIMTSHRILSHHSQEGRKENKT